MGYVMMFKIADLLPSVDLQDHQKRVLTKLKNHPGNILLYHALGSGKSLTSISAAEQAKNPYTAIVPASLRQNFKKEQERFTDQKLPSSVMSYSELARGKQPEYPDTLIADEAQRLKNPGSHQTIKMLAAAQKAKQTVLLSGTPVVNDPADFAPLMSILTNKPISQNEFRSRYIKEQEVRPGLIRRILGYTPGINEELTHEDELKELLKGHVDYYAPQHSVVPVKYEDFPVEMSSAQANLYHAMWNKLPAVLRWKLKWQFPLNKNELSRMTSFLVGPREVGLSTLPFMRGKANPYRAFQQSPKLQTAFNALQEKLKDERAKALIFSNFIDAGLTPYGAALNKAKIPYGVFHGGLSDIQRKQVVDDYNAGKIRVALLGPSGAEGLSFKGTQAIQLLDPYWNAVRGRQSVGRGLRYDSHFGLPEDLQNVTVQRFTSRLPLSVKNKLLSMVGFDREAERHATDDYLQYMSERKDRLNNKFLGLLKQIGSEND
jgi:superfamily II DNA or RNA helicase